MAASKIKNFLFQLTKDGKELLRLQLQSPQFFNKTAYVNLEFSLNLEFVAKETSISKHIQGKSFFFLFLKWIV